MKFRVYARLKETTERPNSPPETFVRVEVNDLCGLRGDLELIGKPDVLETLKVGEFYTVEITPCNALFVEEWKHLAYKMNEEINKALGNEEVKS